MSLCIDLFCGLGGWAEGFLAEGYRVIGFDIERHDYGTGGYPGQLVLQDVLTLDGKQFRGANVIVASPPCQAYSYRAMPWCRLTDAIGFDLARMDDDGAPPAGPTCNPLVYNDLFNACFRIAREAGKPLIVENVKGAERWVGPARWHYGSYFLWGDVPALMPTTAQLKRPGRNFHQQNGLPSPSFHGADHEPSIQRANAIKNNGGSWFAQAHNTESGTGQNPVNGVKGFTTGLGKGHDWRQDPSGRFNSKSDSRKAASAQIAKIPFPLAQHIARVFK